MTSARDAHLRHVAALADDDLQSPLRGNQGVVTTWPYSARMWKRPPTVTASDVDDAVGDGTT